MAEAESCTVFHAENKRSLPAWMLKPCSDNRAAKPEDQNMKTLKSDEQTGNLDQTKPIKRNAGRRPKHVDSEGTGELGVLRRCEGRAKARKTSKNAVKDEFEEIEEVDIGKQLNRVDSAGDGELGILRRCSGREEVRRMSKNVVKDKENEKAACKNARKAGEGAAQKNSRKRKLGNVKSDTSSPETIDDDEIELTIEDLVSIAEEYVNADELKQHELGNVKTAGHYDYEHTSCHTISTGCTASTRNTNPSEYGQDESSSHQEQQCPSFKMTGDIVQDMLNVFLGPLLSKPANYVKEPEPIESVTTTIYHVPEQKDWRSEVPRQGEPVVKKKSSLKDKVALFF